MITRILFALTVAAAAITAPADVKDAKIEELEQRIEELKTENAKLKEVEKYSDEYVAFTNRIARVKARRAKLRQAEKRAAMKGEKVSRFYDRSGNKPLTDMRNALGKITKSAKEAADKQRQHEQYRDAKRKGSGKQSVTKSPKADAEKPEEK